MYGSAEGSTSLRTLVSGDRRSTLPTFSRSGSIEATPKVVLISAGHSEHRVTVTAETMNDFGATGLSVT